MIKAAPGQVRIIAGQWRGRKLKVSHQPGLRPTPDRVRETLFNWLAFNLPSRRCLDLFAGSGALGIEAASRGAATVVLVEKDRTTAQVLSQQLTLLAASQIEVIQADALWFLQKTSPKPFDIVFLDPPYGENLLAPSCDLLAQRGWLTTSAYIYLEAERQLNISAVLPTGWSIIRQLTAGQVASYLAMNGADKVGVSTD